LLAFASASASAATVYVEQGDRLSDVLRNVIPGDTVIIRGGYYDLMAEGAYDGIVRVATPGTSPAAWTSNTGRVDGWFGNYTTIKAEYEGTVYIRGNLHFAGSYINVEGLKIDGSFSDGNGGYYRNNSPGLFFMDSHHINVYDCAVNYCGGGGINFIHSDCISVFRNEVQYCATENRDQHSGISVYQPIEVEAYGETDPEGRYWRIKIAQNGCHNNRNTKTHPTNGLTDGNGIILDDYKYEQEEFLNGRVTGKQAYDHRTLVEGNQCNYNGGCGIQAYLATKVTIKNNTCVGNRQHTFDAQWNYTNRGQVSLQESRDCHVLNNVLVAKYVPFAPNAAPYAASHTGAASDRNSNTWGVNLLFGSQGQQWWRLRQGSHIYTNAIRHNPQFINENGPNYDFTSQYGYDRGERWQTHIYYDLDGIAVYPETRTDLGCLQN
ncbi:MAG: hypothetical protein AAFP90_12730, partial [Planctomycetota bacterium]